jgi:hypothetical protein
MALSDHTLIAGYALTSGVSDTEGAYNGLSPQNMNFPEDSELGLEVADFNSSYYGIDNDLYNGFDTEYSFSMWLKPETIGGGQKAVMVNEQHGSYYSTFGVYLTDDGQLYLFVRNANGGAYDIAYTGVSLVVDEWSHVVATWSGTEIKWYVDGALESTTSASRVPWNSPATLWIGANATKADKQYYDGKMSDLRFWYSELTASDVAELHAAGQVPIDLGIIHKWSLDTDGSAEVGSVDLVAFNSATHIDNVGSLPEIGSGFHPATSIALNPSAGYTISTWFKGLKSNAWNQFVAGGSSGTDGNFAGSTAYYDIAFDSTDLHVWNHTSPYYRRSGYDIMSDTNLDTGWHNIVAAYDGTQTTFYVDGVQVGNPVTWSGSPSIQTFGSWKNFADRAPADFMDDIRVWKRTLSSTEVEELYNNGANPQGENNNMGQITFTFSGLMYDGWESEGTWRLMQGATVWDSGTLASLGLTAGDQLVITADNVPTTNIAGGVPIRLEVSDVYNEGLGDGMFQQLGAGNLLTMVGSGAGGVSSSSTFTFSEADSRLLENTGYVADTSGFYVQWYSSGMDNSWGNTGDYSTGQLPQDGSVVTWHNEIVAGSPPPAPPAGPTGVVRTRVHHDQLRMPTIAAYGSDLVGEFATPLLAASEASASYGTFLVQGMPLEYFGLDIIPGEYGARGAGIGEMIVNKAKLDEDITEMEVLISDEENRASDAEAAIQADVDQNELDGDNDRALIRSEFATADADMQAGIDSVVEDLEDEIDVERLRIDALLSGSSVDLDQLVELVAAYELG